MNPLLDNVDRQVVPRWRTSRVTASLGELGTAPRSSPSEVTSAEVIAQKVADWRRHRAISFAADVLASAIVEGDLPDAREAAEFVLSPETHASEAAKTVANRVLRPESFDVLTASNLDDQAMRAAVSAARRRTREDLRNALAWADLSLSYVSLGFLAKAKKAMEIAAALAPTNRYVLRAWSRLLLHVDEFDSAVHVLRSAPNVKEDPWLLAAEIAVSEVAERRSRCLKHATGTLVRQASNPFQFTRLAG